MNMTGFIHKTAVFAAALVFAFPAHAQDQEKEYEWSVEIGTGAAPFHTYTTYGEIRYDDMPRTGPYYMVEAPGRTAKIIPSVTLSSVVRFSPRWDAVLTGNLSRQFLVDNERYWSKDKLRWSATLSFRYIWKTHKNISLYSALGVGFVPDISPSMRLFPGVTLIGMRSGWEHLYFFLENNFSPYASVLHGGMGWKF